MPDAIGSVREPGDWDPGPELEADIERLGGMSALCRRDMRPQILASFLRAISNRYGTTPECVIPTLGASQAITQVLFALARPGDHVIVERPTYEPLHRIPEMLGLSVSRLERKAEERWEPLPDRLARLLTPKTRAVILSSLHNPSGVGIDRGTLEVLGEMAARVGALVLIDEVYLDFAFDPGGESGQGGFQPACLAIDNGVSWSSITKTFGFAALRAGWVVTRDADAASAMRLASQYFHIDPPTASLALATAVVERADVFARQAARKIAPGRARLEAWLSEESRVEWVPPSAGQTCLLRLPEFTQDVEFATHLRQHYDTQVVPGSLFECPGSVRVGFNLPTPDLSRALGHVSAALDDFQSGRARDLAGDR